MNILFCSHSGNLEGAPLSLLSLCTCCKKEGHTCTMVLGSAGMLERKCEERAIPFVAMPNLMQPTIIANEWKYFLAENKPELVVINTYFGASLVSHCRKMNIPVIWIIRESEKEKYMELFHHEQHYFRDANAVVFPSAYTRNLYAEYDTGNFYTIHTGIDLHPIDTFKKSKNALRECYGIPQDAFVCTSVGTIHPLKGFDTFFRAGIEVLKEHSNTHFFVAGPAPSEKQQSYARMLLGIARKHGMRSQFHIYGETLSVFDHFKMSDVYVCASKMETFPRTILEAMAFELTVIASNVGGIPEQINQRKEGLLYPQGDVSALAESIKNVLADASKGKEMGRAGRKRVEESFQEKYMYNQFRKLMDTVTNQSLNTCKAEKKKTRIPEKHPTISLIFRASKPKTIPDAVKAAKEFFPHYKEFIIGASPSLPKETLKYLQEIPRVRFIPGTNNKMQAGDLHYRLMETSSGDWIVNVDDDDMWCYAPSLGKMPEDVGLVYGHHLYCNFYLDPSDEKYFSLEKSCLMHKPADARKLCGSCWAMRRSAFQSFAHLLIDRSFYYSDLKVKYLVLYNGWKAHYTDTLMGIVRRYSFDFPKKPVVSWQEAIQALHSSSS